VSSKNIIDITPPIRLTVTDDQEFPLVVKFSTGIANQFASGRGVGLEMLADLCERGLAHLANSTETPEPKKTRKQVKAEVPKIDPGVGFRRGATPILENSTMNIDTLTIAEVAMHRLTMRRDPEAYLRTCLGGANERWITGMLAALEFVRQRVNSQSESSGEPTKTCTCCHMLKPVVSFRDRIDNRYPGRTFTVATCQDCERGYCRIDSARRSAVKLDRVLRIRADKLMEEDPEFRESTERMRSAVASRMAHGFPCKCEGCKL
jgi:hypothetical protein